MPLLKYRLFAYLAHNVDRVLMQDQLLEPVWGAEYVGESQMLQVTINQLRRKIEEAPACPRSLRALVGVEYQLAAHPTPLSPLQGMSSIMVAHWRR